MLLTTLLPGLRELRTPLAAGYTLLVAVYILVANRIPSYEHQQTGLPRDVIRIGTWFGSGASLIVLTFIAYLIGAIWQELASRTRLRRLWRYVRPGSMSYRSLIVPLSRGELQPSRKASSATLKLVDEEIDQATVNDNHEEAIDREALVYDTLADLNKIPYRLLGSEPDLWSAWDRLRTEAEFRSTVSAALVLVFFASAWAYSPFWLLGLAPAGLLWRSGGEKEREAFALILELVRAGRVDCLPVQRIRSHDFDSERE